MVNDAGAAHGAKGRFVRCDVAREEDIASAVRACVSAFGRLDFAFNNAGVELSGQTIAEASADDYQHIMDINVRSVLLSMKHEIHAILKSGGGAIVNNASALGLIGIPGMGIYVASKHAVIGLTKVAALELAQQGIRVNAVAPAVIRTDMAERFLGGDEQMEAQMRAFHPMNRLGRPDEVADPVVWLCAGASFVTGHTLSIDGGVLAQ